MLNKDIEAYYHALWREKRSSFQMLEFCRNNPKEGLKRLQSFTENWKRFHKPYHDCTVSKKRKRPSGTGSDPEFQFEFPNQNEFRLIWSCKCRSSPSIIVMAFHSDLMVIPQFYCHRRKSPIENFTMVTEISWSTECFIDVLTKNTLQHIFSFIAEDPECLYACRSVCHKFKDAASAPTLWKPHLDNELAAWIIKPNFADSKLPLHEQFAQLSFRWFSRTKKTIPFYKRKKSNYNTPTLSVRNWFAKQTRETLIAIFFRLYFRPLRQQKSVDVKFDEDRFWHKVFCIKCDIQCSMDWRSITDRYIRKITPYDLAQKVMSFTSIYHQAWGKIYCPNCGLLTKI